MIFEHTSYRGYLRATLAERVGKNSKYSLRAMATQLGMAPSSLSQVIKGTKNLSLETALQVATRAGLKSKEIRYFCLLVQAENEKNPILKDSFIQQINQNRPGSREKIRDLNVDQFKMISDWYHFPILELTKVADFEFNSKNIAKRLGISPVQAEAALERLERLMLLERGENGKYIEDTNRMVASSIAPNAALRSFHKQMLEKAIESLETQTHLEKVLGSETFAVDAEKINEAREIINDFFERMVKLCTESSKKSDVYHLGVQFFNLTQIKKNKKNKETL
jgi:uncharacterized protein (TIGR02147 family)